jgi:hypothetical protein
VTGSRAPRSWRPGRHFGRRLTRLPPLPRPAVPLYALGTAARIERVRLRYQSGGPPATAVQETLIIQNGCVPSLEASTVIPAAGMARGLSMAASSQYRSLSRRWRSAPRRVSSLVATMRAREAVRLFRGAAS